MTDFAARALTSFLHELGGISLFYMQVFHSFAALARTRDRLRPVLRRIAAQVAYICLRSLSTVAFAGIFVGAILVLQFNMMLRQYDAQGYLGGLNTSALVREVGPLIISFLLAGKIGAYTAAELATMRVTEQIDAIECLGTDAFEYLILPRFGGIVISSVLLLMIGLIISVIGSTLVAAVFCGVNPLQYAASLPRFTGLWTVFCGFVKSLVYGAIVACVCCFKGLNASGGARGVGRAVTLSAVYTFLYIVIADFVTSNILEFLSEVVMIFAGGHGGGT